MGNSRERVGRSHFADDALYIDEQTDVSEVYDFIRSRIEKPIVKSGTVVWNFNSHEVDREALDRAIETKLTSDHYLIPFQVAGTWGVMFDLLPEEIKQSEVLVYKPEYGQYFGYQNFYSDTSREERQNFRSELSRHAVDATERSEELGTDSRDI